jgi:hypothetical protein
MIRKYSFEQDLTVLVGEQEVVMRQEENWLDSI